MRLRPVMSGLLGTAAVGFAVLTLLDPPRVTEFVGPVVTQLRTEQRLPLILTAVLCGYGAWGLLVRGRLWSHRTQRDDPATAEPNAETSTGTADAATDATPSDTTSEPTGEAASSISVLGREVVRFASTDDEAPADNTGETDTEAVTTDRDTATSTPERERGPYSVRPDSFDAYVERPPETVAADDTPLVGADFDDSVADAKRTLPPGVSNAGDDYVLWPYEADTVQDRLRDLRRDVERHRQTHDHPDSDTDAWTGDSLARTFLGTGDASLPFRERLRAWLVPERTLERAVSRTVIALERHADEEESR